MSDHDDATDPMDAAYARAEAALDDASARAVRRARMLGAVTAAQDQDEAPAPANEAAPSRPRLLWMRGGGLAAASMAGLGALIAAYVYSPTVVPPPPQQQAKTPAAAQPTRYISAAPASSTLASAPPSALSRLEPDAREAAPATPPSLQIVPLPPPLPIPLAPTPALAPPPVSTEAGDVVVTGSRLISPSARSAAVKATPPDTPAAKLRAAAAAGRLGELTSLLVQGVPIDAQDDEGDTALMQAVRADHPAAAALLARHGADLDLTNQAGVSARDMAAHVGDPRLDQALGLAP